MMTRRHAPALMLGLFALICATLIPAAPSHAATGFPDVPPSHPFATEIEWLVEHDITTGYDDGSFKGSRSVSRQAMAAFMYRLAGEPSFTPGAPSFRDVPRSHPFYREIEWLAKEGISTGYDTSRGAEYRPSAPVSRQAMAAFLYRLADEPAITRPGVGNEAFADVPGPGQSVAQHPFFTAIEWMAQYEISTGYSYEGTSFAIYQPSQSVSRQAMAAFMKRMAPRLNAPWGTDYIAECSDGIDNDGDGLVDYPADPNCIDALDNDESPQGGTGGGQFGNPGGGASVPSAAQPENTSNPDKVVGTGTPASCTSSALATAVRSGGVITFNCGPAPHTINLNQTLYTCNTHNCEPHWQTGRIVEKMVLDGGGLITLNGQDQRGIYYANSCDEALAWPKEDCNTVATPKVTFQNIRFEGGNATQGPLAADGSKLWGVHGGGGGGAIAMRGGTLKVVNSHFSDNRCMTRHADGGGGAIRRTMNATTTYIVNTTIDNNRCANGAGISGLHSTIHVLNSVITNNTATGIGANDGDGGNGGGMYGDGNKFTYRIDGSIIANNTAPEGGPGVFFVSNNLTGHLIIRNSQIVGNTGQRFSTAPYRNLFYRGDGPIQIHNSTVD